MELKYTSAAVANSSLAVNLIYINSDGHMVDDVRYIHIVAWIRLAQAAGQCLASGQPVFIEGRLHAVLGNRKTGRRGGS